MLGEYAYACVSMNITKYHTKVETTAAEGDKESNCS